MILLTIVIWIGISKVAASSDPSEVEEHKKDSPLQVVGEGTPINLIYEGGDPKFVNSP
ncbi:hypothetical protein [Pontibacillus sp. HMF3514]|uniref:hypothetical protein n=1 Tax=Pontibacillus sp. HMF3514 TaxID=2692425 RepID=UPI001F2A3ED9|nr:hypothetical protein [Pontibacillus sp. HMF3514]